MVTRLPSPKAADRRGLHQGRPYELWLPVSEPGEPPAGGRGRAQPSWPGMVIVHGAGSGKENHADFARACTARGWAALTWDQRGHGESRDEMTPAAVGDVTAMARLLASVDGVDGQRICARGSSMGGFMAIHAAAVADEVAAVIAICPAGEQHLRRGLRSGELGMRADADALDAWLGEHDLREAVELMGAKPLILIHARGDDRIPYTWSEELYARAAEPRKLIVLPGGHHRSVQHDPELQGMALRWIERALGFG